MASISLTGARTHNLQSVDIELPLGKLIVVAGVSGSGKSSLALDTLHVEGRRRLVETLSLQLRALLDRQPRPDLDRLVGLPPTLAITQNRGDSAGPRSTVGTLTDLQQLLGVLFARLGTQHCPESGERVETHTQDEILDALLGLPLGTRLSILAPARSAQPGPHTELLAGLLREGFARVRVNGEIHRIEELPALTTEPYTIQVVIDRIRVSPEREERISDALRTALVAGQGRVLALMADSERLFMEHAWCPGRLQPLPKLSPALLNFNTPAGACPCCQGVGATAGEICEHCAGARLSPASLALRLQWRERSLSPAELMSWPLSQLTPLLLELAEPLGLHQELARRLDFLQRVGLGYLSVGRAANTLSRGELQRLRLSSLVTTPLRDVLYVLDEPTAGLHPQDTHRLLQILHELRDAGNTLLVVEHDPILIAGADQVVEIGPGAGAEGGRLVFQGPPAELLLADTPTGRWMSGRERCPPGPKMEPPTRFLRVTKLHARNLDIPTLRLPLERLSVITGPGGAGKSTLLLDTLLPALQGRPHLPLGGLTGEGGVERVILVGGGSSLRSPRSNVATYSGIWTRLRGLYAATRAARVAGFEAGHFSLNQSGGRCEACAGSGQTQLELGTLPNLSVPCAVCGGARFDRATLGVRYKGLNPSELLQLSVRQARRLFANLPRIHRALKDLEDVGLGYLPLGQSGPTLSGGEVQRLRIARDLSSGKVQGSLYLLDEPCSGLHPQNVADLVALLHRLVQQGATVLAIAHDPVLISAAHWEVALEQGRVVFEGAR